MHVQLITVLQFAETTKPNDGVFTMNSVLLHFDSLLVPADNLPEAENNNYDIFGCTY